MLRASVDGSIDFTACDGSKRWWQGALLKLSTLEQTLTLKVLELQALRASGVQGMADLGQNAEYRQNYAIDAVNRFQARALPWLGQPGKQNSTGDPLDAIAMWYAVFGKDLAGKNLSA